MEEWREGSGAKGMPVGARGDPGGRKGKGMYVYVCVCVCVCGKGPRRRVEGRRVIEEGTREWRWVRDSKKVVE